LHSGVGFRVGAEVRLRGRRDSWVVRVMAVFTPTMPRDFYQIAGEPTARSLNSVPRNPKQGVRNPTAGTVEL